MMWPFAATFAAMLVTISPAQIDHAIESGRIDQARLMIAHAIEEGAAPASLEPSLARIAYKSGAFEEALARGEGMLGVSPDDPAVNELVGLSALALGKDERALRALAKATASPTASWRAWNGLGVVADRSGDFGEARAAYAHALALAPTRAEIVNNLGWSYFLAGDLKAALPFFERAVAADQRSPLFAANRDLVLTALAAELPPRKPGEDDEAYAARLNDLGVVALSLHQRRKAIAAFSQAIEVRGEYYGRAVNNLRSAEGSK